MTGIVWLASYPKSGNTWLRVFLARLLTGGPVDLNQLNSVQLAVREVFDRGSGWPTADLSPSELEALRLPVQQAFADQNPGVLVKTHEVFSNPRDGRPRIASRVTRCALYLIRNPLDIAVSLSHHFGTGVDAAIQLMNTPDASLAYAANEIQLPQLLCDWSTHVQSWTETREITVIVLRYEDMLANPERTLGEACARAGFPSDGSQVADAVSFARFDRLQRQETETGFAERMTNRVFFRRGRSGTWRDELTRAQVDAIVGAHGPIMRRYGYLDPAGKPVA